MTINRTDGIYKVVNGVGAVWRRHRRTIPLEAEEHILDLLLALQPFVVPDAGNSLATNVKEACSDVRTMLEKLSVLANVMPKVNPAAGRDDVDATNTQCTRSSFKIAARIGIGIDPG